MHPASKHLSIPMIALLTLSSSLAAQSQLNLMPWPAHMEQRPDSLNLHKALHISSTGCDERVDHAIARFENQLSLQTGVPFSFAASHSEAPLLSIHCAGHGLPIQSLAEDESYHLTVDAKSIGLTAPNPLGAMHGLQTILQLVQSSPTGWILPAATIDDSPRFPWRGLMIDNSRHFMSLDLIRRNVDGMAAVKLNVLHLHLSDDTGFRVESKRAPKLTQLSTNGQFYTQTQIRNLILYARDRGVRIVPEFDVPGHSTSWLAAYPELASAPGPIKIIRSHFDTLRPPFDPTKEGTYKLLNTVVAEMAALFPDEYFHIGGDEVEGKYWDQNPGIQAWMKAHNIKDNHALQAYFNQRLQKIVTRQKKHMEGWDEILSPDLPKGTLVQSWRGPDALAQAAKMGYPTLLSAGFYLDLMYPASFHYAIEPFSGDSAHLTPEQQKLVIGGEAAEWSEFADEENIDNRIWPRTGAIAERLWSPASLTDQASMYARLAVLDRRLNYLDLRQNTNSRRMIERIADGPPSEPFKTLMGAVEPVKEYNREKTQDYNVDDPLNRLIDAVTPESEDARRFNLLTQAALKNPSLRPKVREWLTRWSTNDAALEPSLQTSALRLELVPLSQDLAAIGSLGLDALNAVESTKPVTADQQKQQLATLDEHTKSHAELQLAIEPSIRLLIQSETIGQ